MNNDLLDEKEQNYADVLAVKSDDELKAVIKDGHLYSPQFVKIARNELMERTLGKRARRTEEEIAAEKAERERLRLEHEARLQAEREEQRRQKEEQEERERQEREELRRYRKNFLKKLAPWAAGLLLLVVTFYIIVWNNTTSRYLDCGLDAAQNGNVEKALKFVAKAEKKGLDETTVTWEALYRIYDCAGMRTEKLKYMELLADAGVTRYALFWGLHLADTGKSSKYYLPYLEVGKGAFNENCDQERAKALYLIGNDMYSKGDTYNANQQWARSAFLGCNEAKVRMGDYELCHHSELPSYEVALSYYKEAGLPDMPGVKEKIAVLEQIVKSDPTSWQERKGYGWFEADRTPGKTVWGCMNFKNAHAYAKFVNGAGGTVTGLPHTDCIWCANNHNGAYSIYAGGMTMRNKDCFYSLDGEGVMTWYDGEIWVGRWHEGKSPEDRTAYPAEHFW